MPRGQYDRAAARKRKEAGKFWQGDAPAYAVLPPSSVNTLMRSDMAIEASRMKIADLEHQLAEALEKVDKLQRLCNTHGLWVE